MKFLTFLFCISFLFYGTVSSGQSLEKTRDGYKLDDIEYTTKAEILALFNDYPKAKSAYQQALAERKKASKYGLISIVSIGLSAFFISQYPNPQADTPNSGLLVLGAIAGVTGCSFGLAGINYRFKSGRTRSKKVVNAYNEAIMGHSSSIEYYHIGLQRVGNRLGLVLNF